MNEFHFYWLGIICYILSGTAYIINLCFKKERFERLKVVLALAGLVFHGISILMRWKIAGHGPYLSTYEILSSNAWVAVAFFMVIQWRFERWRHLGALVLPLSFLMMGFALMGSTEVKHLPPTLRSGWLVVHIIFAKFTVAGLLVATACAVFYLMKHKRELPQGSFLARLPEPPILDDLIYRMMSFAFIALTIMIIAGAIWGNYSWGSYWSWDVTQTWLLVLWIAYGVYLHGRITFRWKGLVSAWYTIIAFLFSILVFFVIPYYVKSMHSKYMVG